jgi:phosphotransferase family enzyme
MAKPQEESDVWRILLFGRCGTELLLLRSPSGFRLPELRVPRCQRIAPNLNAEAKRLWKLDTVCLLPLLVSQVDPTAGDSKYHVMELYRPEDLARIAPDFLQLSAVNEDSFADKRDYLAVRQRMGVEGAGRGEARSGPFSAFGAFGRISAWVEEQLRPLGVRLDGEIRQLQATASFALIRFKTNRGAVWFKAVGEPNLRELPITGLLAAQLPQYVPDWVAAKAEWNAWLTAEAPGQGLFESSDPAIWCRAAEFLAEMQIASLPHTADLLAAGAHDVRSEKLLDLVDPFFSVMEDTMRAQTKITAPRLGRQEIGTVREQITEALHKLEEARIPDALNHLDLNPCNVVISAGRCSFLDWAQAAIGNPFFSIEYLRQQFLQVFPGRIEAGRDFYNSYVNRWKPILADNTADDLSHLVPLTAAFVFASSALRWQDPNLSRRPEVAGFLRSLVRRMHLESEQLRISRVA